MGYKTFTCPYARRCGGCEWLAVPYPIQLERKKAKLGELFEPFGVGIERMLGMDDPRHYRAKIMSPFVFGKAGKPRCGMYEKGTHDIVENLIALSNIRRGDPFSKALPSWLRASISVHITKTPARGSCGMRLCA